MFKYSNILNIAIVYYSFWLFIKKRCIPLILQPTRITSHSNTLIDKIFSNVIDSNIISGNLTATISDHLPQFAIIPNMFGNISGNKSNIYERDWSKFDWENFILDYSVDWEDLLKFDELNVDNSTKIYLDKINMLLDTYAPLKKINKYKLKFKSKPWITLGLQKSISVKNKLLTNFINKKDPILKEEFHTNYKKYRNLLSTLMKKSKQAYYDILKEIGIILRAHGKESNPLFLDRESIQALLQTSAFHEGLSFMVIVHNPACISTLALAALGWSGCCKSYLWGPGAKSL